MERLWSSPQEHPAVLCHEGIALAELCRRDVDDQFFTLEREHVPGVYTRTLEVCKRCVAERETQQYARQAASAVKRQRLCMVWSFALIEFFSTLDKDTADPRRMFKSSLR